MQLTNTLIKLSQVLEAADSLPYQSALFLPRDEDWNRNTRCAILPTQWTNPDAGEGDEDPEFARQHGLTYALSVPVVQDIVVNAQLQKRDVSTEELVTAFLYYYDNDAFYDFGNLYG